VEDSHFKFQFIVDRIYVPMHITYFALDKKTYNNPY